MANKQEAGTQSTTGPNSNINPDGKIFRKHMHLLRSAAQSASINSTDDAPIFTNVTRGDGMGAQRYKKKNKATSGKPAASTVFNQFGLLAGDCEGIRSEIGDPRLFYNVAAPSSAFICGSQGSGKSHTLSCLLENCLVASDTNVLPRPLSGIAFHYDSFTSDSAGSPCEAAYLSSNSGVKVRVLCAPTNTAHIKVGRFYDREQHMLTTAANLSRFARGSNRRATNQANRPQYPTHASFNGRQHRQRQHASIPSCSDPNFAGPQNEAPTVQWWFRLRQVQTRATKSKVQPGPGSSFTATPRCFGKFHASIPKTP